MEELRRFAPFAGLSADSLSWLAAQTRMLDVPAGRWLVRRGRTPPGEHFLLSGSLRTFVPDQVIDADQELARLPVLPGAREVQTLTRCKLLQVPVGVLGQLAADALPPPVSTLEDDGWQVRFLRTHIMTRLSPTLWQSILSQLQAETRQAGSVIIRQGDQPAERCCFIVAAGRAEVLVDGRQIKHLGIGDLTGEDALLSDRPRNASVRMIETGRVMRLGRTAFLEFLERAYQAGGFEDQHPAYSSLSRREFDTSAPGDLRERINTLDPCCRYQVVGPDAALALFLLRSRGLAAFSP